MKRWTLAVGVLLFACVGWANMTKIYSQGMRSRSVGSAIPAHLSQEDVRILVVWGYVVQKWSHYTDQLRDGGDPGYYYSRWRKVCDIAATLPTSDKYRDLTDAVYAEARLWRGVSESDIRDRGTLEASGQRAMEAFERHLADFQYVQAHVSQAEIQGILDDYFPSDL